MTGLVVLALTGEIVHRAREVIEARYLVFSDIVAVPSSWFDANDPIKGYKRGDRLFQSWKLDIARSLTRPEVK